MNSRFKVLFCRKKKRKKILIFGFVPFAKMGSAKKNRKNKKNFCLNTLRKNGFRRKKSQKRNIFSPCFKCCRKILLK